MFLGLGSNLGDRLGYLTNAIREISKIVRVRSLSSLYETEPVGYTHQPKFLNVVMGIETPLTPCDLLHQLKSIEERVGRKNTTHLYPREIDVDILLYEGLSYRDQFVCVPHPELHRRRFVLEPFNEIAPNITHPILGQTICSMFQQCTDPSQVTRTSLTLPREF